MYLFPAILAADDDNGLKFLFWIVVAVIWGIATLVGAMKNKLKQQQRRSAAEQLPIDLTPRMEVKPPPAQLAWQMNVPSVLAARGPVPRAQMKGAPRPPPLPRPTAPVPRRSAPQAQPVPAPPPVSPAQQIQSSAARSPSAARAPLAANLAATLRPRSLRTQWLLTEILNKPLSLRDDPLGRP